MTDVQRRTQFAVMGMPVDSGQFLVAYPTRRRANRAAKVLAVKQQRYYPQGLYVQEQSVTDMGHGVTAIDALGDAVLVTV